MLFLLLTIFYNEIQLKCTYKIYNCYTR